MLGFAYICLKPLQSLAGFSFPALPSLTSIAVRSPSLSSARPCTPLKMINIAWETMFLQRCEQPCINSYLDRKQAKRFSDTHLGGYSLLSRPRIWTAQSLICEVVLTFLQGSASIRKASMSAIHSVLVTVPRKEITRSCFPSADRNQLFVGWPFKYL